MTCRWKCLLGVAGSIFPGLVPTVAAGQPGGIDTGDTAWMLAASAMVLAMIVPGLALFYGGLVRSKNVLGTIMQSLAIVCLVSVLWMLIGYSLAFGPDRAGVIGGLEWVGLRGVGLEPHERYAPSVPHQAFMVFQLMFAAITPALITGAFAERMKFSAMLLFSALWSLVVYAPIAHWLWGGGWLARWGALDFAGGAVVHISSGAAALAAARLLGERQGFRTDYLAPHNLPLTLLGTGLLWFGWFGFNGGSALGANRTAVTAFVATHAAAAAAALTWMAIEWLHRGAPTVLGAASGVVAGLATVTAGAGYIAPFGAALLGMVAGGLSYLAITWKGKWGYDDSLDVVGIHGVGGCAGMILTGVLASPAVDPGGAGLGSSGMALFGVQLLAVLTTTAYALVGTFLILLLVKKLVGVRVTLEQERMGLDLSQHNERAYS